MTGFIFYLIRRRRSQKEEIVEASFLERVISCPIKGFNSAWSAKGAFANYKHSM